MVTTFPRFDELKTAIEENSLCPFLDTITTLEEFEVVEKLLDELPGVFHLDFEKSTPQWFRENLEKYAHVRLDESDFGHYPLVWERIKSHPGGKIIYRRFFDFAPDPWRGGVDEIAEHILELKTAGNKTIRIKDDGEFDSRTLEVLASYTQYQVRSLVSLLFPGLKHSGQSEDFHWTFE